MSKSQAQGDDLVQELFRRHSSSALTWEHTALTLRYGMEVLYRQTRADIAVDFRHRTRKALRPSLHQPCLMLAGLMLEVLMKAVALTRTPSANPIDLSKNHDLVELADKIGLTLSAEDRYFLARMSEFVRWAGKYPSPKKPSAMTVRNLRGNPELVGGSSIGNDIQAARLMANRLEAQLDPKRIRLRTGTRLPIGKSRRKRAKSR
jgi:hypothetical protein